MRRKLALVFILLAGCAAAQKPRELKPGFNLFSRDQDVQLGKEAATEIEKQVTVVNNRELTAYVQRIGQKLAATPEAGGFPYTFRVVNDKSINAFALPGGPAFVNSGLLAAADNEAQVAGVLAHEISHVALRHGTNQASKANLIQLPAALAAGMLGGGEGKGSMLGSLAQLGIGIGANSVLLRFSRDAERDADLLGTRMMARVGYNPVEMARFFQKLEAEGRARGPQFFSSHPNPGNRVKAVQAEISLLPRRDYTLGDGRALARTKQLVAALPPAPQQPKQAQAAAGQGGAQAPAAPRIAVSGNYRQYSGTSYTMSYPDNWQASPSQSGVTIAPQEGLVQSASGGAVGAGVIVAVQQLPAGSRDLRRDTQALLDQLASSNPGMKLVGSKSVSVNGQAGMLSSVELPSPYQGETETDSVLTVERPDGLFYTVFIAPRSQAASLQPAFDTMIRSIRFK